MNTVTVNMTATSLASDLSDMFATFIEGIKSPLDNDRNNEIARTPKISVCLAQSGE